MNKPTLKEQAHGEIEKIFRILLPQNGLSVREEQITLCHAMLDTLLKNNIALLFPAGKVSTVGGEVLAVFGSAEEGRDNPEGQLPDPALKQRQYAVLLLAVRPGTWLP